MNNGIDIVKELSERGLIADHSAPLKKIFEQKRTVYIGIDPTADSMQVGNLATLLLMKRLGNAGHTLIFLVGGATGLIGDPREKGERPIMDKHVVQARVKIYEKQIKSILGDVPFRMVNNADWLTRVHLIDFIRDIGKHFTVNELIKRDTIRRRLEAENESISYTEFTYSLLQGYDYFFLNEKYNCDVQIGGADQWTNILSGVELLRRKKGKEVFAFTMPLVTDALGKKFGKTEGNAVWLSAEKTSPLSFYQFWLQLPDDSIEQHLYYYTFLSQVDIIAILAEHKINKQKRFAQKKLAMAVTEIVHGGVAAARSAAATDVLFSGRPPSQLSKTQRALLLKDVPSITLREGDNKIGHLLVDVLVTSKLATSKSDARRLINAGGIYLNGIKITDNKRNITTSDFTEKMTVIKKGKHDVRLLILK